MPQTAAVRIVYLHPIAGGESVDSVEGCAVTLGLEDETECLLFLAQLPEREWIPLPCYVDQVLNAPPGQEVLTDGDYTPTLVERG